MNYLYALIIIIIVFVLYNMSSRNVCAYEDYLYGFWVAEGDDFCDDSGIESMLIFIGEPENDWASVTRKCYIIIMNDLCNQSFTMEYRKGWSSIDILNYKINIDSTFDDEEIWPDNSVLDVDMRTGVMKIYKNETLYAKLTKQNDTSNCCRAMEGSVMV